jgi:hypothetical protein
VIRDNILKSSGLMVNKLGGPSVKPLQPDGLWFSVTGGGGGGGISSFFLLSVNICGIPIIFPPFV